MIAKNNVVGLTYTLTSVDEENEILDEATSDDPLYFIYGVGALLQKFEENISALNTGDKFDFIIPPQDAYGDYYIEDVVDLPKNIFMIDGVALELYVGAVLPMMDSEGNERYGEIVDITDDAVTMDFNHPLAGVTLHFKGQIVEIRPATQQELEHGHVHGPHGYDH